MKQVKSTAISVFALVLAVYVAGSPGVAGGDCLQ